MIVTRLCALALALIAATETAGATVVIYNFSGQAVSAGGIDGAGNSFTGSFSYDNSVPSYFTTTYGGGTYSEYLAARTISFESGSVSSVATSFDIDAYAQVVNGIDQGQGPFDEFYLNIGGLGAPITNDFYTLVLRFHDSTGKLYDSTDLPASVDLNDFDAITFYGLTLSDKLYEGTVTSLTPVSSAVPEPTSWAMMLAGLVLVGGVMRRRQPVPALTSRRCSSRPQP